MRKYFQQTPQLSEQQVFSGLQYVIKDGVATEAMVAFTAGNFLVAIALYLGATNIQIGILAALPTLTNVFQIFSIWLVQKFNTRRGITVICSFFARFPLLIIGALPFFGSKGATLQVLIFFLSMHYFFGSVAGASWNSWMKDLVPEKIMGSYFAHRSRLTQIINVTLSLLLALALDYTKTHFPSYEIIVYSAMFLAGGLAGMLGVYALYRAPEPKSTMVRENLFLLLRKPLQEKNFKKFLIFNSCWAFAVNLVTPFYAVYMMKTLGLPLSYIIILTIAGQLTSISFVRIWGKYADSHSNKTIVQICAPVLIVCIFSWSLISLFSDPVHTGIFLAALHILTGAATSGINLALNNIGLKLAPARESIVYIAARNIVLAFFSAAAPMVGGLLADILSQQNLTFFKFIHLEHWDVFFVIGGIVALFSLRMLKSVYETGEMGKAVLMTDMRRAIVTEFNKNYSRQVMQDKFKGSFNMRSLGIFNMRSLGKNITRRIDNIIVYKRA